VTWLAKQINSRGLSLCAVPSLTERRDYSANGHISNRSVLTWDIFCALFPFFFGKKPMKI
jgi:hypothetical protein